MHWLNILGAALIVLFAGHLVWIYAGARRLRGRATSALASHFPQLADTTARAAVYCFAPHCGACRSLTPAMRALRERDPRMLLLDISERPQAARALGIRATPTVVLISAGRIQAALLGQTAPARIEEFLGSP
jgi:thiol-disulfide isomerase/thioredoxin